MWTTFNDYQWDLNWSNPDVVCEFAGITLFLANRGVDCLRLDAIAFIWKRLGTTCQNEPEVHALTRTLRAVARMAAPSLVFKAEAIVGPEDVVHYLGVGDYAGCVSDLAYHNSLMVQIWSALATRDVRLLVRALDRPWPRATAGCWSRRCNSSRPSRRPPRGPPTCAATTTSAGRSTTPTPPRSDGTVRRTAASSRTGTPVARPARSRWAPSSR